ncbi:unnamed protein product [Parnassius mnemosyne]|uniref:Endonuclease/exonuclease/phosphatase domain-containing protein n=1 Tax=Parnassius mnemosyne TaxID=213953 RepID=A0AAV1MA57_9NEOP
MICTYTQLEAQERTEWMCTDLECLWVTVPGKYLSCQDRHSLHIGVVYIPPDNYQSKRLDNFIEMLTKIITQYPNDHFIVAGDFNLANISWSSSGPVMLKQGPVELQNAAVKLIDLCNLSGLNQHNIISNYSGNVLDLVFSNINIDVTRSQIYLVSEDKYHPSLLLDASDLSIPCLKNKPRSKLNFYRADYDKINKTFSEVNWSTLLIGNSIDVVVQNFYSQLNLIIDKLVPTCLSRSSNYPVWYPKSLRHIIREKLLKHKNWKKYKNPRDYDEFCILRTRQKKLQKQCHERYSDKIQSLLKNDPKILWSYLKSIRNSNSTYPNTLQLGNELYTNETNVCAGFNKFFESAFQKRSSSYDYSHIPNVESNDILHNIYFSTKNVSRILHTLKTNTGPGSDGIPPLFIHKCAKHLAKPLNNL